MKKTIVLMTSVLLLIAAPAYASNPTELQKMIAISNQASLNGASASVTLNSTTYNYKIDSKGNISVTSKGKLLEIKTLTNHLLSPTAYLSLTNNKLTPEQTSNIKKQSGFISLNSINQNTVVPTYVERLQRLINQSENTIDPSSSIKYEKTRLQHRFTFQTLLGVNKTLTFDKNSRLISAVVRNGSDSYTISYRYGKQTIPTSQKVLSTETIRSYGING